MVILQFLTVLIIAIVCMLLFETILGNARGTNKDKRTIKEKSLVQSWMFLVLTFLCNFLFGVFHLTQYNFPESSPDIHLFYFITAIGSYFLLYIYNSLKAKKRQNA